VFLLSTCTYTRICHSSVYKRTHCLWTMQDEQLEQMLNLHQIEVGYQSTQNWTASGAAAPAWAVKYKIIRNSNRFLEVLFGMSSLSPGIVFAVWCWFFLSIMIIIDNHPKAYKCPILAQMLTKNVSICKPYNIYQHIAKPILNSFAYVFAKQIKVHQIYFLNCISKLSIKGSKIVYFGQKVPVFKAKIYRNLSVSRQKLSIMVL
jgi:hypothetical protein